MGRPACPRELFGSVRLIGNDSIRCYFKRIEPEGCCNLVAEAIKSMWHCLTEPFILDWDSTVYERLLQRLALTAPQYRAHRSAGPFSEGPKPS